MFAWLTGIENCVCSTRPNHASLWETDLEVHDGPSGIPGLKGAMSKEADELSESPGRQGYRGQLPPGPKMRAVPTYVSAEIKAMVGDPVFSGNLMQIKLEESVQQMAVSLHANGFSMTPITAKGEKDKPAYRAWSPFSLVEKCQVKTLQHSAYWAVFKLTVFRAGGHDHCLYFACTGGNAYKERDRWVQQISELVGAVTLSLLPASDIAVQPLPGVDSTRTRIMAGFLLQACSSDTCQVVYCELHAYSGGEARLSLYRDEWCDREVASLSLSDSSTVSTRTGAHCNVFGIDHHRFCARNADEKDLWLRAVSNIKVKLMFEAPDPTAEELAIFRGAVQERIQELMHSSQSASVSVSAERGLDAPLLSEITNLPPMSPRGDALDPDPIEEPAETSVAGSPLSAAGKSNGLSSPLAMASRDGAGSGDVAAGPEAALASPSPLSTDEKVPSQRSQETSKHVSAMAASSSKATPGKSDRLPAADEAASLNRATGDVPTELSEADGEPRTAARTNSRSFGPGSHRAPLLMQDVSPSDQTCQQPQPEPASSEQLSKTEPQAPGAASQQRQEATHQEILQAASASSREHGMPSNASRSGAAVVTDRLANPTEMPYRQSGAGCDQPLCRSPGVEMSETALDCLSTLAGAEPRLSSGPSSDARNGSAI